jgi:hypothetical protein
LIFQQKNYAIYFLGKDLEICDTPVLRIYPTVIDVATGNVVEAKSKFIEAMNHKCWVIQISCLKQRRRNELELLLSVFDQSNITSDIHILNVREEDFPEKYRPVIRRLKIAAGSQEMKKEMENEDRHLLFLKDIERSAAYKGRTKGRAEGRAEMEDIVADLTQNLAQKDQDLAQKDQDLAQKNINTVINSHKAGLPIETITFISGLSIEEVKKIIDNNIIN